VEKQVKEENQKDDRKVKKAFWVGLRRDSRKSAARMEASSSEAPPSRYRSREAGVRWL
jgi:hypothetical protein